MSKPLELLRWYVSTHQHSAYDLIYLAPSHLRRAEILERLGRPDRAAGHYRRFVELWKDCDPELRPLVDRAQERLASFGATASARPSPR